jgi:hypothetical protein
MEEALAQVGVGQVVRVMGVLMVVVREVVVGGGAQACLQTRAWDGG